MIKNIVKFLTLQKIKSRIGAFLGIFENVIFCTAIVPLTLFISNIKNIINFKMVGTNDNKGSKGIFQQTKDKPK